MHPSLCTPVGEWLKTEIVTPAGVSVTALAKHLGISRQTLSALLNGNARLSAVMAIRFEKAFGIKAYTLLRMRAAVELAHVCATEGDIKVGKFAAAVEHDRRQDLLPRIG
jgi:addiction module HigA family antidote